MIQDTPNAQTQYYKTAELVAILKGMPYAITRSAAKALKALSKRVEERERVIIQRESERDDAREAYETRAAAWVADRKQLAAMKQERDAKEARLQDDDKLFRAMSDQLAASQAREQQLREALETIRSDWNINAFPLKEDIDAALSTQTDHAALDARLKEERERCAKVCDGWLHADGDCCAAEIRSLV